MNKMSLEWIEQQKREVKTKFEKRVANGKVMPFT